MRYLQKKTPEVPLLPEKTLKLPKIKTTTYKTYEKATSRRFCIFILNFFVYLFFFPEIFCTNIRQGKGYLELFLVRLITNNE
jgi:hypothetical protein